MPPGPPRSGLLARTRPTSAVGTHTHAQTKTAPEVAFRGRRYASRIQSARYSRMMPRMFRIQMNRVTKLPYSMKAPKMAFLLCTSPMSPWEYMFLIIWVS